MRAPHLTTIAAALMTAGGGLWTTAMASARLSMPGVVICGLHQGAQPGAHCGWCYLALAMVAAGAGLLLAAGLQIVTARRAGSISGSAGAARFRSR